MRPRVLILAAVLLLCLAAAVQAADSSWTLPSPSPDKKLSGVVISGDGQTVIAGGDVLMSLSPDGTKKWAGHAGTVVAVTPDGKYAVASVDKSVRLYDAAGNQLWDNSAPSTVTALALAPDLSVIAAGTSGGQVQFFSAAGNDQGGSDSAGLGSVKSLALTLSLDQLLATDSQRLYAFNTGGRLLWTNTSPGIMKLSGNGRRIVTANGGKVYCSYVSGYPYWNRSVAGDDIVSLGVSDDGSVIVAGSLDNNVYVLDSDGNTLWNYKAGSPVRSVGISGDGSVIAAGTLERGLYFFDGKGNLLATNRTDAFIHDNSVAVSHDGSLVVAADENNVYGFSTRDLAAQVTAAATPSPTMSAPPASVAPATAPLTAVTPSATSPPPATTTQQAALPLPVIIAALLVLPAVLKRS